VDDIDQQTFRGRSTAGISALFGFFALLMLFGGIGALTSSHTRNSPWIGWLGIALSGLMVLLAIRAATMGVVASGDGIQVRKWVRTPSFEWSAIREFRFGNEVENLGMREIFSTPVLQTYVVLKDGHHVPMVGLQATRLNRGRSRALVQRVMDELESRRERFQPPEGGAEPEG
jgi:hypothetical protein